MFFWKGEEMEALLNPQGMGLMEKVGILSDAAKYIAIPKALIFSIIYSLS